MNAVGFIAEAFSSAEDFLKSERLQGTSCPIADMQMPGMTGLELHTRLVASGRTIPTILITAYPDARSRARALGAGIACYSDQAVQRGRAARLYPLRSRTGQGGRPAP